MQSGAFDSRIVIIGIQIDDEIHKFSNLYITAKGTKFANANQNECEVVIANLNKATRDYLTTAVSPFNKNKVAKKLTVDVGRQSWGTTRIYSGDIASVELSEPPDIKVSLKAATGNFKKGNLVSRFHGGNTDLSTISQGVAGDLGVNLDFQASNKSVANYSYSGGALNQVDALGASGGVDAYVDDNSLVVKDTNVALTGSEITVVKAATGMVGSPEFTDQGIRVKYLIQGAAKVGSGIRIESTLNPATNGTYVIYKLGFDIATRDMPFYWIAEGKRIN